MELQKNRQPKMFEIRPTKSSFKSQGGVFPKGRLLLGRTESCDIMINHDAISAVHAVLEIFDDKAMIYDMNSTNGTYVNDDKIIVKEIHFGDFFRLADVEFEFLQYKVNEASLPPVLDTLEPEHGQASVKMPPQIPVEATPEKSLPKSAPAISANIAPSIVYPLAADPKAEFSEYIFEDKEDLYPIFKYETTKQAVEVIILFKDNVFSIDYLPETKGTYQIAGLLDTKQELEFPYLGKADKFPFVDVKSGQATVYTIPGFSIFHLSDRKKDTGHVGTSIDLIGQDLVRFQKDHLQIFVRNVAAPPKIAAAPILKRDADFRKYLFIFLFTAALVSIGILTVDVPEDVKKDELAPERLATILYKQQLTVSPNRAVEKTENAPKRIQKAPDRPAVSKVIPKEPQPNDVKKPDVIETKDQSQKPDPGKKTAPEKKVVKQGTEPVTKPTEKIASPIPSATKPSENQPSKMAGAKSPSAFSNFESKSIGHVEVYKSADFKSSVSSLMAKGGSLSGIKTQSANGGGGGDLTGASTGFASGTGNIKTSSLQTNQGSLVGATTGVLGDSKGAEGLSAKKAIYTAGMPGETVVLGSMDPDVIRRILMENLPQFRYCYQKELEARGAETAGVIKLNFTIGASGHVSQAGVDGSSSLPTEVKKCVVGVLRGITFPEPLGGGTVEVKQPMNFQPKRI